MSKNNKLCFNSSVFSEKAATGLKAIWDFFAPIDFGPINSQCDEFFYEYRNDIMYDTIKTKLLAFELVIMAIFIVEARDYFYLGH